MGAVGMDWPMQGGACCSKDVETRVMFLQEVQHGVGLQVGARWGSLSPCFSQCTMVCVWLVSWWFVLVARAWQVCRCAVRTCSASVWLLAGSPVGQAWQASTMTGTIKDAILSARA